MAAGIFVKSIQRETAAYYGVTVEALLARRGKKHISRPRLVAITLAARLTSKGLNDLGRFFDGRDHTTILAAIRNGERQCLTDDATKVAMRTITKRLLAGRG